jgi:hypothetical protein
VWQSATIDWHSPPGLQHVEGVRKTLSLMRLALEQLEVSDTLGAAEDRLAVQDQGGRPKPSDGLPRRVERRATRMCRSSNRRELGQGDT